MNLRFQNSLARKEQAVPPVWFMRQAGRYHRHYQALRKKHDFMALCKTPELAAEVALGPIGDFDFDVSILFSDLLFPLEAMGMGLSYGDSGPKLAWHLDGTNLSKLVVNENSIKSLAFQGEAMKLTRQKLPKDKSLIGFVGGPWTLFSYACQGQHDGSLIAAKKLLPQFLDFGKILIPLLEQNIKLQLDGGAECIMLFDTAAGELAPRLFNEYVVPGVEQLAATFPGRLGYYSKGTQSPHLFSKLSSNSLLAGLGFDHRWELADVFMNPKRPKGFVQGNFDQALLFCAPAEFESRLRAFFKPLLTLSPKDLAGWVCGLGHGILPATPEENVKRFVQLVREIFAEISAN